MTPLEKREHRAGLITQARAILNKADAEKRGLNAEETAQHDKIMVDVDNLKVEYEREERQLQLEAETSVPNGATSRSAVGAVGVGSGKVDPLNTPEYRAAFESMVRNGCEADRAQLRSLHVADDPKGGYFVSTEMENQVRPLLENENIMRRLVTVLNSSSDRDIPFEDSYGEAYWKGEEKSFQESEGSFSMKNIGNHKLTALVKVSEELLQDSSFPIIPWIASGFAKRYGRKEETAILTGDGAGKPRGIVLDATLGVTTAANNAITSDELIDLFHALPRYHRASAKFLMADLTAKVIRKLKNAVTGDYMWQPGLVAGQPDMILGKAVEISDDIAAFAASAKCILFGDYKEYLLVDRRNTVMQRLNELYAITGQVGFRGYKRLDGRLLRPAAVQYLQIKA